MNPLRAKALAALREGRVIITYVYTYIGDETSEIEATVESSRHGRPKHIVDYRRGEWSCITGPGECPQPCAHTAAVALVTGHYSEARR